MKKLLLGLLCLLSFSFLTVCAEELPEVTDHEKVTVYIFRGSGCSHCYEALTYFNEVASQYKDYFVVKTYEVWENPSNSNLVSAVSATLGDDVTGVPYIVVGDNYHKAGFAVELGEEIIAAALEEYENPYYTDAVANIIEEEGLTAYVTSLKEACIEEGIIVEPKDKSKDTLIVVGIFAVLAGGMVALVLCSRKK